MAHNREGQGLPGPLLFERQSDLAWAMVAALYVSNLMLLILNIPLVGIFARLLTIPTAI